MQASESLSDEVKGLETDVDAELAAVSALLSAPNSTSVDIQNANAKIELIRAALRAQTTTVVGATPVTPPTDPDPTATGSTTSSGSTISQ